MVRPNSLKKAYKLVFIAEKVCMPISRSLSMSVVTAIYTNALARLPTLSLKERRKPS